MSVLQGLMLLVAMGSAPPEYTEQQVERAIEYGYEDGRMDRIIPDCEAKVGGAGNRFKEALSNSMKTVDSAILSSFDVRGESPLAMVSKHAAKAQEAYRAKPDGNDPEVLKLVERDWFYVYVTGRDNHSLLAMQRIAEAGIGEILIRPRGDKKNKMAVQPLSRKPTDEGNQMFGFPLPSQVAIFDSEDVLEIARSKNKDVEVIILPLKGKEYKCRLKKKEILRGYGWKR